MYQILPVLVLSLTTVTASAAARLTCAVKMYQTERRTEYKCGSFEFNLPVDSAYQFGKGECSHLRLFTSYSKDVSGSETYGLTLINQHPSEPEDYLQSSFAGEFPKSFSIRATAKSHWIPTAECTVGN